MEADRQAGRQTQIHGHIGTVTYRHGDGARTDTLPYRPKDIHVLMQRHDMDRPFFMRLEAWIPPTHHKRTRAIGQKKAS